MSEVKRGRPQKYPLTSNQVRAIVSRLKNGLSPKAIAEALDIHPFAVLRVRRTELA